MRLFSPFDLLVIPIIVVIFFLFFVDKFQENSCFEIYIDGKTIEFPLTKDTIIANDFVEIELKNQTAKITKSDCPNQICVAAGLITSNGQIVCVPNRIIVSLHKKKTEIDVYVH
jgi:hypothetical protein